MWLLDGHQLEWDEWVAREMQGLRAGADRMFAGRDHLHTAVYRCVGEERGGWRVGGDRARPPVRWRRRDRGAARERERPRGALVGPDVPTVATFTIDRVVIAETSPPPHDLVLGFTPGDPLAAWQAGVEPVLATWPGVGFASPFVRTIPGTDAYIDEL